MNPDLKTWNLLLLATAVVVLLIATLIITVTRIFDDGSGAEAPTTTGQTTPLSPEQIALQQENAVAATSSMVIDTRASDVPVAEEEQVQEYIDAFTDDSIGASGAPRPSGPSPFASDEYNAREQQMREQGLDELPPADPTQIPTESEPVSVPNPSYEDPAPPTVQPQPVPVIIEPETMELPVLNSSEFAVCDDLEVPSSPLAQLMFLNSASANPTVVCLGEAVGDACEATTAEISVTGGVDGSAYVVERNDGQCALGFSSDAETAALCDLTSLLETSTGETRSFSEWSDEFDADPGGMMAMLIEDNVALFTGASSGASCVTYELPR